MFGWCRGERKWLGEESVRDWLPSADKVTCQLSDVLRMWLLLRNAGGRN